MYVPWLLAEGDCVVASGVAAAGWLVVPLRLSVYLLAGRAIRRWLGGCAGTERGCFVVRNVVVMVTRGKAEVVGDARWLLSYVETEAM